MNLSMLPASCWQKKVCLCRRDVGSTLPGRTFSLRRFMVPIHAKKQKEASMNRWSVAQVANLAYRRLPIGEVLELRTASGLATRDTADRLSAPRPMRDPSGVGSSVEGAVRKPWLHSMKIPAPTQGSRYAEQFFERKSYISIGQGQI